MTPLYTRLLRQVIQGASPRPTPASVALACASAPAPALPAVGSADGDERPGCGWFDSSLALRQGLAVTEWLVAEQSLQRLWSSPPAHSATAGSAGSARLH